MPSKERMAGQGQVSNFGPDIPKKWETFTSSSISNLQNWFDFSDPDYVATSTLTPGNPLAYYNMEEGGSGTTLTDRSQAGHDLDGTISNGTWSSAEKKSGTYSLSFNGSNTSVEIDDICDDIVGKSWSIFAWVKTGDDGSTANRVIFAINDSSGGNRVILFMTGGKVKIWDSNWRGYNWYQTINDEEWYHVGMVYVHGTPGIYRIYINGVFDSTYENATLAVVNTDKFTLGAEYDGGSLSDFWNGYMDEITVFDSAITAEQVKELYNGGGTPPDLTSETIAADTIVKQTVCKITDREWGPYYGYSALAPSYQTMNGRSIARFSRGEYLTGSLTAGSYTQPTTIITAIELANTGSEHEQSVEYVYDGDDATYRQILYRVDADIKLWAGGTDLVQELADYTTGALDINTSFFHQYSSHITSYITGSVARENNQTVGTKGLQGFYMGARYSIDTTNGSRRLSGSVGEILVFNKDLSPDEHLLVTTYLANKWKIFKSNNIASSDTDTSTFDILS